MLNVDSNSLYRYTEQVADKKFLLISFLLNWFSARLQQLIQAARRKSNIFAASSNASLSVIQCKVPTINTSGRTTYFIVTSHNALMLRHDALCSRSFFAYAGDLLRFFIQVKLDFFQIDIYKLADCFGVAEHLFCVNNFVFGEKIRRSFWHMLKLRLTAFYI